MMRNYIVYLACLTLGMALMINGQERTDSMELASSPSHKCSQQLVRYMTDMMAEMNKNLCESYHTDEDKHREKRPSMSNLRPKYIRPSASSAQSTRDQL